MSFLSNITLSNPFGAYFTPKADLPKPVDDMPTPSVAPVEHFAPVEPHEDLYVPPEVTVIEPPAIPAAPAQKPERTLRRAVDLGAESLSIFYSILKGQARTIIRLTGTEAGVARLHRLIVEHGETIFWSLSLINVWQNWTFFTIGAFTGLAIGTLGKRAGIIAESVQILKTPKSVIGYNYLSGALLVVLAPWLTAFQGGVISANYLVYPPVIQDGEQPPSEALLATPRAAETEIDHSEPSEPPVQDDHQLPALQDDGVSSHDTREKPDAFPPASTSKLPAKKSTWMDTVNKGLSAIRHFA